jgi:hypothetical protein
VNRARNLLGGVSFLRAGEPDSSCPRFRDTHFLLVTWARKFPFWINRFLSHASRKSNNSKTVEKVRSGWHAHMFKMYKLFSLTWAGYYFLLYNPGPKASAHPLSHIPALFSFIFNRVLLICLSWTWTHYVAQAASNSPSFCRSLLSAGITGVCHLAWFINNFLSVN